MLRFPLLVLALTAVPAAAQAQAICVPRQALVDALKDEHREVPVSLGVTEDGRAAELFASPDGKTWTFVVTTPAGVSCVFAAGKDWDPGRLLVGEWAS